jgi:hypothetical protein
MNSSFFGVPENRPVSPRRKGLNILQNSIPVETHDLVGVWVVDETDRRALTDLGNVLMEFDEGGGLLYTVRDTGKKQIIKLRYWIEGSSIFTDQPSKPQLERTEFSLSGNVLTLTFDGVPYRFLRKLSLKQRVFSFLDAIFH